MVIQYEANPFGRAPSKWDGVGEELKQCVATGFLALAALALCLFTFALAVKAPHTSLYAVRMIGSVFLGLVAAGNALLSLAGGFRAIRAFREAIAQA